MRLHHLPRRPLLPLPPPRRTMATTLETLRFDNCQLRELPVDTGPNEVRTVRGAAFARVAPTPVVNPRVVALSAPALALLGLRADEVAAHPAAAEYLSGNRVLPGAEPAAHAYCGHQFGSFAGQLGDGATMYLGEVLHPATGERWELQFKGAGKTPFSRTADGRKVLRSSLREFLCSEAMAALGVPTTRAGSVVTSDSTVTRDVFYTGDAIQERCTVITRIAPSFLRFGSLEVVKSTDPMTGRAGPSAGDGALLDALLGYVCRHFYGHLAGAHAPGKPAGAAFEAMYVEIVRRSAALVAQWQAHGFAHGVLNTDNMSLLGLTIDYGPFGWMVRAAAGGGGGAAGGRVGRRAPAAPPS
jgi:serine/tyrosine/threonine adenylyltransferase